MDLPVMGQGTWNTPESGSARREAQRAIERGIELGMTHLDTAEMYGAGAVEQFLGEAIRAIPREKLFITTKVLPSNASYQGTLDAAQRSLERLRCDYLDLDLLHWPGSYPLEETMQALEALVERGTTRFVGVSNFETDSMLEAASYLRAVPLACNQVLYHLGERGIEHELIPIARQRGVASVLESVARKYGATPRQVALAFLTREQNVFAIPKAAQVAHVEENAAAGSLTLDAGDIVAIDEAFPRRRAGPLATL